MCHALLSLMHMFASWDLYPVTVMVLEGRGWEVLQHLTHSPYLTPSSIHLFGPLKVSVVGQKFEHIQECISFLTIRVLVLFNSASLFTRCHIKPGEILLVHGASGAVGIAAVQIAKAYGK